MAGEGELFDRSGISCRKLWEEMLEGHGKVSKIRITWK